MAGKFELYKDKGGEFRFRLKAGNGQVILASEGYKRRASANNGIASVQKNAPNDALILAGYGRALLSDGQTKNALQALEKARSRDYRNARLMQDLAIAYSKTGNNGMASTVTAERYALEGRLADAGIHARRAVGQLPEGSTGWQRAHDIMLASERAQKRKK